MRTLKKIVSFMFSRLFLVAVMLLVQISLIALLMAYFSQIGGFNFYLLFSVVSLVVVVFIVSNTENPSYKITWLISILLLPLTGVVFYLILGNKRLPAKIQDIALSAMQETRRNMPEDTKNLERLAEISEKLALQSRYIYNMSGYPLWEDAHSEYFPLGDVMFERMLEELEKARRYIFLEYFIVTPGYMWSRIFEILSQKVASGVEVRMMYDDIGCIRTLPKGYDKVIRGAGIKLQVFNPFRPRVSMILNNRDHRKLCVIDGETAFCGGINIADEYINAVERHGHWKDTGVMLRGAGVWSFVFMFLQQWSFASGEPVDFEAYRGRALLSPPQGAGLFQGFGDSPLDRVNVTENAYLGIISRATRYVYITTPYLVIDYEMETALCTVAQSGIDVRIITPCLYDKWYVHMLTRSHYPRLIRAGVKIFEYSPGFMHGKTFVSDDHVCMVGTCNMDFRSFYLHFECSAAFYHSETVIDVKRDFLDCQQLSHEVALEESLDISLPARMLRSVLKLFAPLI